MYVQHTELDDSEQIYSTTLIRGESEISGSCSEVLLHRQCLQSMKNKDQ